MTRVLVRAYDVKRDHLDAYDVETLIVPAIVDEKTWVPELDREDLLYHRLFLAEKWLVLKLRYGHADPRDAGVGNIVNCGAAMYIAPVGIANAGDPRRRVRRGARPDRRAPVELRARGRGRARGRRRRGDAARGDAGVGRRDVPAAREGRRRAPRSRRSAEAAAKLDGWRDGGLAELRRAFAPFDSVGEHYATPGAERPHPEPAARDRGAADRARAARRDRRRLRGDGARRRQLRPRLRLDRLDGRCARGRARQSSSAATGSTTSPRRARSTSRRRAATMAVVAAEIFARDAQRHQERAQALAALCGRRGPCLT